MDQTVSTPDSEPSEVTSAPNQEVAELTVIPDRIYFRIGDVAEITSIKPYVLRFWEKEFDVLRPVKNHSGQRIFRKRDVENVLMIKRLLYKERYSIEGAKKRIKELRKSKDLKQERSKRGEINESKLDSLKQVRRGLTELVELCTR